MSDIRMSINNKLAFTLMLFNYLKYETKISNIILIIVPIVHDIISLTVLNKRLQFKYVCIGKLISHSLLVSTAVILYCFRGLK